METLKTVVGWVLMLIAVATAIQIVAQSTYDAQLTVWFWLDIAIAFALAVALISSYMRKSEVDNAGNGVSREFLAANTLFYSSIFVGVLFLWNWVIFLMGWRRCWWHCIRDSLGILRRRVRSARRNHRTPLSQ